MASSVSEFLERRFGRCEIDVHETIWDGISDKPIRQQTARDSALIKLFINLRLTLPEIPPVLLIQLDALYEAGALEEIIAPQITALFRDPNVPSMKTATEFLSPLVNGER